MLWWQVGSEPPCYIERRAEKQLKTRDFSWDWDTPQLRLRQPGAERQAGVVAIIPLQVLVDVRQVALVGIHEF